MTYPFLNRYVGKYIAPPHKFAELTEGFDALEKARKGRLTLREHAVEVLPAQAALLIRLVQRYPDTVERLAGL